MADGSHDFERLAIVSSPPLTWRSYKDGDLDKVAAREDMAQELAEQGAECVNEAVGAYTITTGISAQARPIACGFVHRLAPGKFGLSALVSTMTAREWVFATGCLRHVIRWLEDYESATAIHALVRADFAKGIAYLERFGFVAQSASVVGEGPLYVTMIRRR